MGHLLIFMVGIYSPFYTAGQHEFITLWG